MADIHKDRVLASIESLWTSELYSDVTIHCGSHKYKLHRAIICPRSTFFAAVCKGEFKEAKTGTITLNDDDPQTVERMLVYLYTLDYPDEEVADEPVDQVATDRYVPPQLQRETSTNTEGETDLDTNLAILKVSTPHDPRMMNNALVYALADKYDIPELKELAKRKFQILASSKWPHDDFHAVTETVFSTTPDQDMGLRQIVMDVCGEHFQDILKDEESRAAFLDNKSIATAVLDAAARRNEMATVLLDEAFAKQTSLQRDLEVAEQAMQSALDEKDTWMSRFGSVMENANKIDNCRHCHKMFSSFFECLGETDVQLRCRHCRTTETL